MPEEEKDESTAPVDTPVDTSAGSGVNAVRALKEDANEDASNAPTESTEPVVKAPDVPKPEGKSRPRPQQKSVSEDTTAPTAAEDAKETAKDELSAVQDKLREMRTVASGMIEVIGDEAMKKGAEVANQSLDDLCVLRNNLHPHGYTLSEVGVDMGLIPTVSVRAMMEKDTNLDTFSEEGYTDNQRKVIWALRQKKLVEPALTRHNMKFAAIKVTCTIPPAVRMEVGWSEEPKPTHSSKKEEKTEPEEKEEEKKEPSTLEKGTGAVSKGLDVDGDGKLDFKDMGEAAMSRGAAAADQALEEICALREMLMPFGYTMLSVYIGLALIPGFSIYVKFAKDASLEKLDESKLTDLQRKVVWGLRQKQVAEASVEAHCMQFTWASVYCSVPPHVKFNLGWQEDPGAEQEMTGVAKVGAAVKEQAEKGAEAAKEASSKGGLFSKAKGFAEKGMEQAKAAVEAGTKVAAEGRAWAIDQAGDLGDKALQRSVEAIDSGLNSICALRDKMHQHGFTMSTVYIAMSLVPQFSVWVSLSEETSSLDGLDESELDDLQRQVVWAVKQKKKLDSNLKKHDMGWKAIMVTMSMPPKIGLSVGWDSLVPAAEQGKEGPKGALLNKAMASAEQGLGKAKAAAEAGIAAVTPRKNDEQVEEKKEDVEPEKKSEEEKKEDVEPEKTD